MRLRAALVGLVVSAATLLGAGIGTAPAVAEEGVVDGAGAPDAIPGQYIVVLNAAPSWESARALAERYGGEMEQAYRTALPGFWQVGDTTWPGLGTVACVLGSRLVAEDVLRHAPAGAGVRP